MGWRTLQGLVLHPFGFRRWQSLWLCIDLIRHKEWWLSETVQCMSRCFDISSISADSLVLWHEQCMSRLLWSNQWQHLIVTSDKEVSTNLWGWVYFSTSGSIPGTYSLTKFIMMGCLPWWCTVWWWGYKMMMHLYTLWWYIAGWW